MAGEMPCSKLHAVEVFYSGKSNQCRGEDMDTEIAACGGPVVVNRLYYWNYG